MSVDKSKESRDKTSFSKPAVSSKAMPRGSTLRKVSVQTYIVAGILTLLIFSLGISLGSLFQQERYDFAQEVNDIQDVEYLSLQLQYLLLGSSQTQESCAVLSTTLQKTVADLSESLAQILEFEDNYQGFAQEDFTLISRRYALDNIRYFLLAEKALESCELEVVPILYFHSKECRDCANQGTVLTYYKKLLGDQLLVFPIDADLVQEEPMVDILLSLYGVEEYPSIVIGGGDYPGYISKEDLGKKICLIQHFDKLCV